MVGGEQGGDSVRLNIVPDLADILKRVGQRPAGAGLLFLWSRLLCSLLLTKGVQIGTGLLLVGVRGENCRRIG